ncbi:MAG: PspA/IM30 family protein [Spirochaetales bacterium]|nr:PspA/IM30 family protein [Spirochaetales bacterium]
MGVFTRFKDIIGANINSILDKAEDPEKMIRLMMQEMEDTMVELKTSCAEKIATVKSMEREKLGLLDLLKRWDARAKLAVETGKDDLAREALHEKRTCTNQLEFIEKEIAHVEGIVNESKAHIVQLEEKLEQVSQKHRLLIQRGIHAQDKKRAKETMYYATGADAMRRFDDMENRIERMEAEADLAGSTTSRESDLEREFSKMENSSEVEDELAALKKKMGQKDSAKSSGSKE